MLAGMHTPWTGRSHLTRVRLARGGGRACLVLLAAAIGCAPLTTLDLLKARRAHARADCRGVEQALRDAEGRGALSEAAEAMSVYFRGACLERAGLLAEARDHFRYVVETHPTSPYSERSRERLASLASVGPSAVDAPPSDVRTARNRQALDLGRPNLVRRYFTDFGPPEPLRICILREPRVSVSRAQRLVKAIRVAFEPYALEVEVPRMDLWERSAEEGDATRIRALSRMPLEAPCDRLLALSVPSRGEFVSRTFRILGADSGVEGEVEGDTFSRGYVFARPVSAFHVLGFDPEALVAHEAHHLLRCDHDVVMDDCYRQIVRLKAAARRNRAAGRDFFPGITVTGDILETRAGVDAYLERFAR